MKKSLLTLMMVSLTGAAYAGPAPASKNPVLCVPEPLTCFSSGEWTFDTAVTGLFVDGAEVAGGGAGISYFVTNNIGLGVDYSLYGDGVHLYNGNLILRLPVESLCASFYAIGGVGGISDGETTGTLSAGLGAELRCFEKPNIALFVDARYLWVDDYSGFGGIDEAVVGRVGIRVNF